MMKNLVVEMARSDRCYDPLRYLASYFFADTWSYFSPIILSENDRAMIQFSARQSVDRLMIGEEIFWNVDFSEEAAEKIWTDFFRLISKLPADSVFGVGAMCRSLLASKSDVDGAEFLLNVIARAKRDTAFRSEVKMSLRDLEILDAADELLGDDAIDIFELRRNWVKSNDEWDVKLRNQTPDLPESVYLIFTAAFEVRTRIPLLAKNLGLIIDDADERCEFFKRLQQSFELASLDLDSVKFPGDLVLMGYS